MSRTRARRTVLLTGFDPFGGESTNPSWEAVRRLAGTTVARHRVVAERLPTAFGAALTALGAALERHRPALVLCVGQAGGRAALSVERVALNLIDARIPDNSGAQPIDVPVVAGAPLAYFAPLPVKAIVGALRAAGVPAEVSHSAGTFVCNAVFYGLCHRLATALPDTRGGFVHVPYLPGQAAARPGTPSMALETMVAGLRVAMEAALTREEEAGVSAGALD
jgi:pyroglutamyl-peptidase